MPAWKNTIAVIFDFDDTLTEDSTSALLARHGQDPDIFWRKDVDSLVRNEGWEPTNAWIHLLLTFMEQGQLPPMSNDDLRQFGQTLEPFPGLEGLLEELEDIAREAWCRVEYYIVSGGIEDIIEGFKLRPKFKAAWGSRVGPAQPNGPVRYIKRTITFTEKTRYLFMINKGIKLHEAEKNPALVNNDVPPDERPVPFENMFYVGDGLSDIPCFSLLQKLAPNRRNTFGVFQAGKPESARKAWEQLVFPQRASGGTYNANYEEGHSIRAILRSAFTARCLDVKSQLS